MTVDSFLRPFTFSSDFFANIAVSPSGEKIILVKLNQSLSSPDALDIIICHDLSNLNYGEIKYTFLNLEDVYIEWSEDGKAYIIAQHNQILIYVNNNLILDHKSNSPITNIKLSNTNCFFMINNSLFTVNYLDSKDNHAPTMLAQHILKYRFNSDILFWINNENKLQLINYSDLMQLKHISSHDLNINCNKILSYINISHDKIITLAVMEIADKHRTLSIFEYNDDNFSIINTINLKGYEDLIIEEIFALGSEWYLIEKVQNSYRVFIINSEGYLTDLFKGYEAKYYLKKNDRALFLLIGLTQENNHTKLVKLTNQNIQLCLYNSNNNTMIMSRFTIDINNNIYCIASLKNTLQWHICKLDDLEKRSKILQQDINYDDSIQGSMQVIAGVQNYIIKTSGRSSRNIIIYISSPLSYRFNIAQESIFQYMLLESMLNLTSQAMTVIIPIMFNIQFETSVETQINSLNKMLSEILATYKDAKIILISGSLGAIIASQLLNNVSKFISSAIFLSPVINSAVIPKNQLNMFFKDHTTALSPSDKIVCPMMVYHGSADPYSSIGDVSDYISSIPVTNKAIFTVWDEAHIFKKKSTWINFYQETLNFINQQEIFK